jgi:DNA-directed RNA polymerase specialized sigma24 family protein
MVRDKNRAEDITAAAFQITWEKRALFRGESPLYTWLTAIAFNEAWRGWRRDGRERLESIDQPDYRQFGEPDRLVKALERGEDRLLVRKAVDRIPAKCGRILLDHFVNGHSIQQVARCKTDP